MAINLAKQEFEEKILSHKEAIKVIENLIEAIEKKLTEKELTEYEKWSLEFELIGKKLHLSTTKDELESRQSHFENYFMPNFEKESKECNENFDKVSAGAKEVINTKDAPPMLVSGLRRLIEEYPKDNKSQELKNSLYAALKRQLKSYEKYKKKVKGKK